MFWIQVVSAAFVRKNVDKGKPGRTKIQEKPNPVGRLYVQNV